MENENKKGRRKKEIGYNSVFATRLRKLMEENKTTQPQLAEAVGVSRQAVGQWKDGNTVPDILDFQKIADYYNVPADYLLGRSGSRSNDKKLTEIADYLGISDFAVVAIQQLSGKKSIKEINEWISENDYSPILENGFNSSRSEICNWMILNILFEAQYTIGAVFVQLYRFNKGYSKIQRLHSSDESEIELDCNDFAHLLINKFSDKCKYKLDNLFLQSTESECEYKYKSIYKEDLHYRDYISSIEDYKKYKEYYDDFPF